MKPLNPHDPLDDLIAAALHGELTPEERTQFESRLTTDPAAQAAYLEAQAMHDLLEKTHKEAQPDPAFEQRMVSGVRRKLQTEQHRETAWESLLALWKGLKLIPTKIRIFDLAIVLFLIAVLAGVALGPITNGIKKAKQSSEVQMGHAIAMAEYQAQLDAGVPNPVAKGVKWTQDGRVVEVSDADNSEVDITDKVRQFEKTGRIPVDQNEYRTKSPVVAAAGDSVASYNGSSVTYNEPDALTVPQGGTARGSGFIAPGSAPIVDAEKALDGLDKKDAAKTSVDTSTVQSLESPDGPRAQAVVNAPDAPAGPPSVPAATTPSMVVTDTTVSASSDIAVPVVTSSPPAPTASGNYVGEGSSSQLGGIVSGAAPAPVDNRKLIRNAQLDLQVKSFQTAMDQITALTKSAGGYVDTSNSQKGGNGKLQGTVVVKVLPQNLDAFLLKLRDLGEVQNQSVSTDDVTKDYYDTQARLDNSRRMETQLQDLLKHVNGKVSDLLEVERELGRVRGDIEQMQGQLKLYDFQVQYATVTMNLSEKDLNQAAAYLLKEQDDFSLFATDVEDTFQQARKTADDFKAQVLTANLNHNSGSDVSAELTVMVPPDQIEAFLTQVRGLGRVANFTRQTQRVAQDGGDSSQPADETKTEKDKVQVHLAIRSDDETRKQVALTVVAKAVDTALDQAKTAALANAGVEILGSSLNKTPQGQSSAQLSLRVPGKDYAAVIAALEGLGRTASLSIQRNDDSGPGANGDDAPVIVSLSLTDDDTPLQETEMSVIASDVDTKAQQIKKNAADVGVEVKASSFERQPDGTELAQMTFRLPMAKYPAFLESVEALGKVESLSVRRDDRPDQTVTDDTAPAEISLQLHNQRDIVADNNGLWTTLRQTFGDGAGALFGSIRVIGVLLAFLAPWVFTLVLFAWVGRRIYIWRKR